MELQPTSSSNARGEQQDPGQPNYQRMSTIEEIEEISLDILASGESSQINERAATSGIEGEPTAQSPRADDGQVLCVLNLCC